MDRLKKHRAVIRRLFTQIAKQVETLLGTRDDLVELESKLQVLEEKYNSLKLVNEEIFTKMLDEDVSEDNLCIETTACDEYTFQFAKLKLMYKEAFEKENTNRSLTSCNSEAHDSTAGIRKFRLPQIELKKFGGDVRDWLPFWSIFKKIHEDSDIATEDKFQYLLLAILPNTRARDLVESYPPTADNYCKAIESLKSRFGKEELLVEVYVRELLKLVLNNALSNQSRCSISFLYDKIETQLRALETLGVTTDTCTAMLYPLVESCLPEELLRVWQRTSDFAGNTDKTDCTMKNRLTSLMLFLKNEVECDERIALAVEGFSMDSGKTKKNRNKSEEGPQPPTAAGLMSCEATKCVFCDGNHYKENCFKAQKMTLEEKQKVLKNKKACFRCAKVGHQSRRCRERIRCVLCGGQHLVLLCPDLVIKADKENRGTKDENVSINAKKTEKVLGNHTDPRVFLQTLRVTIRSEYGKREVRAIIDTGSQRSYILKTTAQELKYEVKHTEKIIHALFGGVQTSEQNHDCYEARLMSLDESYACKFDVLDQATICNDISSVYPGIWTQELEKEGITLTDTQGCKPIELLIGSDVAGKLFTGTNRILECGLVAIQTLLGWVLMGKIPGSNSSRSTTMTVSSLLSKDARLSDLWQLDVLGIKDPGETKSKMERELATMEHFKQTVCLNKEGRYEIKLPWREGHPPLPTNYALAMKRLESTEKRLRNTGYYDRYQEVFNEWLEENIIEEVTGTDISSPGHYLPHRPVIKEDRATTKVRPVFDASAKEKANPSLNDCLEKGINLIELIPAILLRFRKEKYGVISDIKKAFLQISVSEKDRDCLRFLWKTKEGILKVYRHQRVVFGVNCSPFLLGATIEFHLKRCLKNVESEDTKGTIRKLLNGFYVDNCVTSVPSLEALKRFYEKSIEIMAGAKFELRAWEFTGNTDTKEETVPLLGLKWNTGSDVITISYEPDLNTLNTITKRVILSTAQRIFDPIGFTCPATLSPKILLQKMWEEKISWDTEVNEESQIIFQKWVSELPYLVKIEIPRWINGEIAEESNLTLHTFCDASGLAYAAAIFLRVEVKGTVRVHLLQAKSRVAPIKKISIPRLELLAASIAARLQSHVLQALDMKIKSYFWSDSSTVLGWIKRDDEWATFVWNRVQEIRALTQVSSWSYVPGTKNPADLPSRGCSPKQLAKSRWWEGPPWLYEMSDKWPQEDISCNESEINKERKKSVVTSTFAIETKCFYSYFSKFNKIVRMIAWICRFNHNCRNRGNLLTGELSVEEFEFAEKKLIRIIQQESFIEQDDKQLASLNVFKDKEGLIRVQTRISRREDLQTFLFPFVLSGKHPVVRKLIHDTHVKSCHTGTQALISILRERFWILGGRRPVRSVVKACKACRRYSAKQLNMETPELPVDRIRDAVTFEITGVDLAGPLHLRDGKKVWICLFTCAIYRCVHLDIVSSISTTDFIKVLRRFISRRGRPRVIYTDNGTNFCGAENIFSQLNWKELEQYSSAQRIRWRFNPPSAPWWGGWWERLIGLLKQLLRRVLGRASLNCEELYTILCDLESVINSRPLTYVSNEVKDLVPLTPTMFLRELTEVGVPDCDSADAISLNKRIRYLQKLRCDLRNRFRAEYLGQMNYFSKSKKTRDISVGEIVIVGNDNTKRIDWPLGRVIELLPGKDNKVRLVRIQTSHGQLLRPIQRLFPLECIDDSVVINVAEHKNSTVGVPTEEDSSSNSESAQDVRVSSYGRKIVMPKRFPDV